MMAMSSVTGMQVGQVRASSPSLRTYGTFGRIQSSLALREDVNAPAASTVNDKESDLFVNLSPSAGRSQLSEATQPGINGVVPDTEGPSWSLNPPFIPYETYSPGDAAMASGWGDGTLNFSMMPLQFDWMHQSLGFDFDISDFYEGSQ